MPPKRSAKGGGKAGGKATAAKATVGRSIKVKAEGAKAETKSEEQEKATAAKTTGGRSIKVKAEGVKAETKSEEQEEGESPVETSQTPLSQDDWLQLARAAYDREQERLRRKEPTRAEQKVIQDRRVAAWIKANPGKTKTDYTKHQKERYDKLLAGIKAQTRFLQMRKIQKK